MAISRMTQSMMLDRSYLTLQTVQGRLAKTQEQLTTGRVLNRPSDSPTGTSSAMRIRASIADETQFQRNAQDGLGWLGQIDSALTSSLDQVRRARDLGVQGVNATNAGAGAREALAVEVEQLRDSLIGVANTTYLGRPVFGGLTPGSAAYDDNGAFVGQPGEVKRTVAKDVKVAVNVDGPDVFGPAGDNLFDSLARLSNALRTGDTAEIGNQLSALDTAQKRITSVVSDAGTRYNRVERAATAASNAVFDLTTSLSEIEEVDLAKATISLTAQEVAYQAALSATARLVQPSLAEFLR
jgi:flagellar hook-associated protein 3 FlgL